MPEVATGSTLKPGVGLRRTLAHGTHGTRALGHADHAPIAMTPLPLNATDAPTASTCPLCGQANQCAIAAGQPAQSCWCMAQDTIVPEALAALAPEQRGKTCICPACGARGGPPSAPPSRLASS